VWGQRQARFHGLWSTIYFEGLSYSGKVFRRESEFSWLSFREEQKAVFSLLRICLLTPVLKLLFCFDERIRGASGTLSVELFEEMQLALLQATRLSFINSLIADF